jgi:hypothetical protein
MRSQAFAAYDFFLKKIACNIGLVQGVSVVIKGEWGLNKAYETV